MTSINPPPQTIPQAVKTSFLSELLASVTSMFNALGAKGGVPAIFRKTGTPATPAVIAGYLEITVDGDTKYIAYYE